MKKASLESENNALNEETKANEMANQSEQINTNNFEEEVKDHEKSQVASNSNT